MNDGEITYQVACIMVLIDKIFFILSAHVHKRVNIFFIKKEITSLVHIHNI